MSLEGIPKGFHEDDQNEIVEDNTDYIPRHFFKESDEGRLGYFIVPDRAMDLSVCSTAYMLDEGKPIILLFCRDSKGNDYVIPDPTMRPYFYIQHNDVDLYSDYPDVEIIPVPMEAYLGLLNTSSYRIYTEKPSLVEKYRKIKRGLHTWEADVLFPNRYLIDRNIFTGIRYIPGDPPQIIPKDMPSVLRKLYVDIEVMCWKSPDIKNTPDEIIMIGLYDNFKEEYLILATKHVKDLDLTEYLHNKKRIIVEYCQNELVMLKKFVSYVNYIKPDIFLSFTNFDWLYTMNRIRKLRLSYRPLSRVNIVQMFGGSKIKIHGLSFLDIQKMYFQVFLSGSKWETLHGIAWRELGEEKLYKEESVYDNWLNKPERVFIRNIRDVEIIVRLDEELALTAYFDAIRTIVGCNFDDTIYKSRIADIMYLRLCYGECLLPSKTIKEKIAYQGGIVFPVEPGIYKNIVIFDWSSMYPSIIKGFNMSFETRTLSDSGEDVNNIDDLFFFTTKYEGWTVKLLKKLEPLRVPFKRRSKDKTLSKEVRLFNKSMSEGIKSVINSIYGVFGQAGDQVKIKAYRMYLPDIAAATTYVGRTLEEEGLVNVCKDINYNLIYADTDSVFLQLQTDDHEAEIEFLEDILSNSMNQFIQDRWGVDPEGLQLSFDTHFRILVMFTKKRYIGKTTEDQTVVKGIEMVRRNTADISVDAQEALSNAIFDGISRDDIISMCKDMVEDFYKRPLEDIGIAQNLTKDLVEYGTFPSHMKAFLWSCRNLDLHLVLGKRFWTAYIDTDKLPEKYSDRVYFMFPNGKPLDKKINIVAWDDLNELPDDIKAIVDKDLMLDKALRKKLEQFLNLLDIDWWRDVLEVEHPTVKKNRLRFEAGIQKRIERFEAILDVSKVPDIHQTSFKCPLNLEQRCPCNLTIVKKALKKDGKCSYGLLYKEI